MSTSPFARRGALRSVTRPAAEARTHRHVLRDADGTRVSDAQFIDALRATGAFLASVDEADRRRSPRWMTAVHEVGGRHGLRLAIRECDGRWMVLDIDWDADGPDAVGPAAARDDWRRSMSRHPSGHLRLVEDPDGSES